MGIILLLLFLTCFVCTNKIAPSEHGTSCPCISYYSYPDYDCLWEHLKSNKTVGPICIELLQGLDRSHRFNIKQSYDFHCADYEEIQVFTPGGGKPELIQKNNCTSTFENLMSFDIVSPNKQLYEIVSKNVELLQIRNIHCATSLLTFDLSFLPGCDWNNIESIYYQSESILFSIHFSYHSRTLLPTNFTTGYDSQLIVAIGRPAWDGKSLSPGKILINDSRKESKTRKNTDLYTLIFSCSWGEGSPHFGGTISCLNDLVDISMDPNKTLTLNLYYQRIFNNSAIKFGLVWNRQRDYHIKTWNLVCKFFDGTDHLYQPESCVSCWGTGQNCSTCWNATSLKGDITPFINITNSFTSGSYHSADVTLLTNLGKYGSSIALVRLRGNVEKDSFPVFQYDYFFGKHSKYIESVQSSSFLARFKIPWVRNSIVLPGEQKEPTALSPKQLNSLSTMCRLRAVYADDSVGQWSNPVMTSFNRTEFYASYVQIMYYGLDLLMLEDMIRVAKGSPIVAPILTYEVVDFLIYTVITSCETAVNSHLEFVQNSSRTNNSHTLNYYSVNRKLVPSTIHTKNKPLIVKCATLHSFALWTEQLGQSDEFKLFQVNIDSVSGKPSGVSELNSTKLCGCSNHKSITAPSVHILYPNLNDPEDVEVAIACGTSICLADLRTNVSQGLHFPWKNNYGNIVMFVLDRTIVGFVTSDDRSQLKIYLEGHNNVSVYHAHGFPIALLFTVNDADVTRFPVPYKHCMYPYLVENKTHISVSANATVEIVVTELWNGSSECAQFDRPTAALAVSYGLLPRNFNYTENKIQEVSCRSETCDTLSLNVHWLPFTIHTPQVVQNRFYLIEINVNATRDFYDIWYYGQDAPTSQTYKKIVFTKSHDQSFAWVIPASAVGTLILVTLITGIIYWRYTQKMYMYKHLTRLSAKDIRTEEKLGEGNFGEVWKATMRSKYTTIVIKMLKESATDKEEKEFREEALLLSKFNSEYIVHAVGICLQARPIMLGLEYVNGGSLSSYLKRDEVRLLLVSEDLLHIAMDALKGCIYLEQEGYIHRDIAARNCLVETESNFNLKPKCVKLSDFGLAKDIGAESAYRSRDPDGETLPIAWTAPEAFAGKFSPKSDVWAFGVLLWEIFTWAATPYGQCADTSGWHTCPNSDYTYDEIEFHVCVNRQTLLSLPDPCTEALCSAVKNVLSICWEFAAEERPSFKQLQKYLNGAKKEILKIDVKKCFAQLGNTSGPEMRGACSNERLAEAYASGPEKRNNLLQQAYRPVDKDLNSSENNHNHVIESSV